MYFALRHLLYLLLLKLKSLLWDNSLYTLNDHEIADYPPIAALSSGHGTALPFVFTEIDRSIA